MADDEEVDLILLASHPQGFLKRTLLGSTTFEMAHAVEVPLLINKDDEEEENVNLLETVLVPTDFSRKSLEALNIIRTLREFVGKVLFVHVIEHSRNKHDYKEKYGSAMLF